MIRRTYPRLCDKQLLESCQISWRPLSRNPVLRYCGQLSYAESLGAYCMRRITLYLIILDHIIEQFSTDDVIVFNYSMKFIAALLTPMKICFYNISNNRLQRRVFLKLRLVCCKWWSWHSFSVLLLSWVVNIVYKYLHDLYAGSMLTFFCWPHIFLSPALVFFLWSDWMNQSLSL